ncbi:MAG: PQQ-binding-like beta-propeller repeat protein [Dysgonamonadaceae bacterium]|jgi:outer membrane protein assembly factor BamB|nr:PQQ-binding-like beta-propeller repeat protein [Dysgonamonadaceae bacterium]
MGKSKKKILTGIIIGIALLSIGAFAGIFFAEKKSFGTRIISPNNMPETKKIENIEGLGLEEYATQEVKPEVFFETNSKIRSAILANDGIIYFGNENNEFYAVDINTKQKLWMYSTDESVQTWPVFTDNKIIFNAGNSLYILDAANGNEIYKYTHPSKSSFRISNDRFAFNDSYVAVADGIAYYAALNGDLVAVDINKGEVIWTIVSSVSTGIPVLFMDTNTGDMIWSIMTENIGAVASGINFHDGKLYYIDFSGSLCCVDTQTKQMIFQTQIRDRIFAPMYISDGKIYVGGRSCKVYCIDADNGNVIWSSFSHDNTTWFSGGSVSVGNTLYTCTSDEYTLVAFDKNTGEFQRIYPTVTNAYTAPVLYGENVIVAAADVYSFSESYIMEFDTKNHTKLWRAKLDDCVLSPPVIYQDVLYFGSDSGIVYSINLKQKHN